jgi:hypothetical protein
MFHALFNDFSDKNIFPIQGTEKHGGCTCSHNALQT